MATPAEIKKALQACGFEVYRTRGEVVHVAERVRENLMMDASVYVRAGTLAVGVVVRAQKSDFPHDSNDKLFDRARSLAASAVDRGYREARAEVRSIHDPGDGERTIDTWCEVVYERDAGDLTVAMEEVRFAVALEKAASR